MGTDSSIVFTLKKEFDQLLQCCRKILGIGDLTGIRQVGATLLLTGLAIVCIGCRDKPAIPKEGDVVVWMHSSELIIKTKLGQRRDHVITDPKNDHLFYEPEYERFIGQFPINYEPSRYPKLAEAERRDFIEKHNSEIRAVKSIHPLEFYLMLNGAISRATDTEPHGADRMDDPNQVKVIIHGYETLSTDKSSGINNRLLNTRELFDAELNKHLDTSSKTINDDLECYSYYGGEKGELCFGRSTHPLITGFYFHKSPQGRRLLVRSLETIYGGIKVEWFTDQKNISNAKYIDSTIWRLLDTWNIAPTKTVSDQ